MFSQTERQTGFFGVMQLSHDTFDVFLVLLEVKNRFSVGTVYQISLPLPRLSSTSLSHTGFILFDLFLLIFSLVLPSYTVHLEICESHADPDESSHQDQQEDRVKPAPSLSRARKQCEIDGPCSQMRSASPAFVCVCTRVCHLPDRGMTAERGRRKSRGQEAIFFFLLSPSLHN